MELQTAKIPLSPKARVHAYQWVTPTVENLEQKRIVYANALAVCAVQRFLQFIGVIEDTTALPQRVSQYGQYWLQLSNYGCVGCIYVSSQATEITVDQKDPRYLGYFVVRLNESIENIEDAIEAEILGFTPDFSETLNLSELQDFEGFCDLIDKIESQTSITC